MRFMMLMIPKGYEKAQPEFRPDAKSVAAMMRYNECLQQAGVLVELGGLFPPSSGARVTCHGGIPKVTKGPFQDARETVGGYWIIQVANQEEAIDWAKQCPASDDETIEVRQIFEVSDLPCEMRLSEAEQGAREPATMEEGE